MSDFLLEQLTSLGVKAEKRMIGTQKLDGKEIDLPPVIIGELGNDPKKASLPGFSSFVATDIPPENASHLWSLRCPARTERGWMALPSIRAYSRSEGFW